MEAINLNRTYAKCGNITKADFINLEWEKPAETIQGRKLFKGGNYSRAASIQGITVIYNISFGEHSISIKC